MSLVPLDETYILYNPSDWASTVSAYLALAPILILMFYLSWFITSWELEPLLVAAGQLLNEALNKILKRLFKQNRPGPEPHGGGPGYGMPSAHAQFVAFAAVYLTLRIALQWPEPLQRNTALVLLVWAGALAIAASRVYLNYHSLEQVCVGWQVGCSCSLATTLAVVVGGRPSFGCRTGWFGR
ncbi:dolichyldiphosphatase KNAG_0D03940 [Huiozyma naganishii CBS 8797]|uniref:Phosphatidic acid phosphatase type 2/haloperoxidase domain-containing protein n=1 Tax=Huiozyma naganishii (strain ATCC MYA-139 / BCRC 22969 / CBS 8797 / KCTC 17520 / NBRC 10181 / NCYC 3082 / Yp74L-3) TaxID=1071383 RepID=J7R5K7_HUIN7|nr:hypothetical protein KNAG_0D03940 [Kazachstania naganishii CBS 8797]CCK70140.1 hypothetical protein KNAG_0D03940 [Kazachstania naganishii CBS 8797]